MMLGLTDHDLKSILVQFRDISLEEAMSVNLNTRKELKFLLPKHLLLSHLNSLNDSYYVQKNLKGEYLNNYYTRYWDTENKINFRDHVRGKNNRIKVRKRIYEDSGEVMLEIKRKSNEKTIKQRISSIFSDELTASDKFFLLEHNIHPSGLECAMDTGYKRITLWDEERSGRITIDMSLSVGFGEAKSHFQNICIMECKGSSEFLKKAVRSFSFPLYRYRSGFSKYAIGMIHHYDLRNENAKLLLTTYKNLCKLNAIK
jgi:hypothetical protein